MKKPKFNVCYPKDKVESDALGKTDGQQKTFYDNLKIVLDDLGYENKFVKLKYKMPPISNGVIDLCFHVRTNGRKNTWCLKDSCLFNHWDFDQHGFAGWSKMTNSKTMFNASQLVDLDQATEFFNKFSKQYIKNNISKYSQPSLNENLKIKQPYVFFPGQIFQDAVVKHFTKINPQSHANEISKQLINNDIGVVFKKHPGGKPNRPAINTSYPNVVHFNGSIHDAIPNSAGVVCINSGVGFESLLYKKHVFTSGICDYHWVTHKIYSVDDIKKIPKILNTPVDESKIIKFVYYMLTEVYVDATSLNSIRKKIKNVIRIYEENE